MLALMKVSRLLQDLHSKDEAWSFPAAKDRLNLSKTVGLRHNLGFTRLAQLRDFFRASHLSAAQFGVIVASKSLLVGKNIAKKLIREDAPEFWLMRHHLQD